VEKKSDQNYLKRELDDEAQVEKDIEKLSKEERISKLQVKDFMKTDLVTVGPDSTIEETINLLKEKSLSGIPVVDKTGKIIGMVSDYDLLLQAGHSPNDAKIKYSKNLFTVHSDATLKEILITFYKFKLRRIPVCDAFQKLLGMVTRKDVLFALMKEKD
jgi:IMP dehydrogenase